jgi:hypothetical protein
MGEERLKGYLLPFEMPTRCQLADVSLHTHSKALQPHVELKLVRGQLSSHIALSHAPIPAPLLPVVSSTKTSFSGHQLY